MAAGFLLALSGCSYFEGLSVDNYLKSVSEIQSESDTALLELNDSLAALSGDEQQVTEAITHLGDCRLAVETALERIGNLEAPEEAAAFKSDITDLYLRGSAIISELEKAGHYALKTKPQTDAYEAASKRFSDDLAAAPDIQAVLSGIHEYEIAVDSALKGLQDVEPPVLYRRSHERLIGNLVTLKNGLAEMARGLESDDLGAIENASSTMSSISAGNPQLAADIKADRDADLRDFNARIEEMNAQMDKVRLDQEELRQRFKRE